MDHRLFFAVGDFLANLLTGAFVGAICWTIVGPGWNMWVAMFAMMALGMVLGMLVFFPVAAKLGAMEAMIPLMYSGMWAGMFVGMAQAMMPMPLLHAVGIGAACGVADILFIWVVNSVLRGVTREAQEG